MDQALSGIKVLDLSQGIAGPYCCKLLADFGADVLKVEPPEGDYSRTLGPFPGDVPHPEKSGHFLWLNLNKRGITLDVFSRSGRAILDSLVEGSDIIVSSYSARDLDALGLTYDRLAAGRPSIVVTAITPFGLTGPYRDYEASELVLDAWGHAMGTNGHAEREPLAFGGSVRQYFAGQVAALATLGARLRAEANGSGETVDVSMAEAQLANNDRRAAYLLRYQYRGDLVQRLPGGSGAANARGGYHPCKDGFIVGGFGPNNFVPFSRLIGREDWLTDPRFQPIADRFRDPEIQDEMETAFLLWLMDRSKADVVEEAQAAGLQFFAVNTFADVAVDKHLAERDYWTEVEHPAAGKLKYPGAPFRMAEGGYEQRRPAPMLGEHNAEVLGQLGLSGQLPALASAGVTAPRRHGAADTVDAQPPLPGHHPASPKLPLEGTRVLDMTAVWAGPYATMLLGDLGAEVVRVESLQFFPMNTRGHAVRPRREELDRLTITGGSYVDKEPGERPWNRYAPFNATGRNKLSMTVDLGRPEGLDVFMRLAQQSDVVLDNYSFGVMERMGLGYESLKAANPGLVVISMPLFGNSGPYRNFRGFGNAVDAFSGFGAMRGYRGEELTMTQPVFHMDPTSGVSAAFAVMCALRLRQQTGRGQFIDFSQTENMLHHAGEFFMDVAMNGRNPLPLGNRDRWGAVQGCYPCRGDDAWVVITLQDDADWVDFCSVLGNPAWSAEECFATVPARLQNHDELDSRIADWTSQLPPDEVMHRLQAKGIAAAPVLNEGEAFLDKHLQERRFFLKLTQADSGTHLYPGHLWKYMHTPLAARRGAPNLGQDNEYLYREVLGFTQEQYEGFVRDRHIGDAYLEGVGVGRRPA